MKRSAPARGFTLVELMVVIAVLSIIIATAVPSFANMIKNNRMAAAVNDTVGALQFARSEAIRRGRPVNVEPLVGVDFSKGLRVFFDETGNGYQAGEELREVSFDGAALTFTPSASASFSYRPNGTTSMSGDPLQISVCDDRVGSHGRNITLLSTGVLRTAKAQSCTTDS